MGILPFRRKKSEETSDLNQLLMKARSGDEEARNQLLREYIPFVAKSASQATGRYIRRGQDDEFSIALAAFNEAIERYDLDRGTSFLGFADTVIKRRLIDYFRSKQAKQRDVPFSDFEVEDEEENVINYVEVQKSVEEHQKLVEGDARRDEIQHFTELLMQFEISMEELVDLSPKHQDARENAMEVAKVIAANQEFCDYLMTKRSLPLKALMNHVKVSRKTIERQRKYIIAVSLILIGDFEMLQDYIM
ncbi:RNA polymerase sigma-I factor [Tumebacillus avium]|uniref:RNA polymerase sigma factor SigI n=1 Tax=Tumebacillus avium TaxID=1903704 RepID=A0A1Y0ITT4_9BACL|nr:RNA polymerase sigma factor SigI [Tumebacillus avium]ARU63720.1 RNA polymerase sigma-I factor [Tumebacillus avium]